MPEVSNEELQRIRAALGKAVESEKRNQRLLETLGPAIVETLRPALEEVADRVREIGPQVKQAISEIRVDVPPVKVPAIPAPQVTVNVPEIKVPKAEVDVRMPNIPKPEITVNVPPVKVPKSSVTVNMPEQKALLKGLKDIQIAVSGQKPGGISPSDIPTYSLRKPMPVILTDPKGEPYIASGGGSRILTGIRELPSDSATYSPLNNTSVAYERSRIVKGSSGVLYSLNGYNSSTSAQFILVHNAATQPDDGAIPAVIIYAAGQQNFSYSADKFGRFFATGITVTNSTTGPTKTVGYADCWFDAQYT